MKETEGLELLENIVLIRQILENIFLSIKLPELRAVESASKEYCEGYGRGHTDAIKMCETTLKKERKKEKIYKHK